MFYAHSTTKHLNAYQHGQIEAMFRLGIPRFMLCGDEITCINRRLCL